MKGKTTGELLEELMEPGSFSSYLSRNREQMLHPNVGRELDKLCRGQKLSKAAVARRSGVSEVYLHQVLAGKRSPSRDRLLCLCIGLSAGVEAVSYTHLDVYKRQSLDTGQKTALRRGSNE